MKTNKPRVLIVDDEEGFTKMLRFNLERTDEFEVEEENDSLRAMETARRQRPDLVILDVVMPGLDGGELVSQIEKDGELNQTPVIFLTALLDQRETNGKPLVNGDGYTYLSKPVTMADLLRCIRKLVGPSEERRSNGRPRPFRYHNSLAMTREAVPA